MAEDGIGAAKSGQAMLGFVDSTRIASKEQSSILFFVLYKDHLDCYAGNWESN